jgi:glycosyltransferase involved in cell wall biosynthesis
MKLTDLTVVLPTRDEARNIRQFLRSLPSQLSLIVVDDSVDETPALIATMRPHRTLVLRRPSTVTEARQWGAEAASTEWLLFTDCDVVFAPDYFRLLSASEPCDALYGPKLSQSGYASYYRAMTGFQKVMHRLGVPAASGSNLLIRREALFQAGGFDLRLTCNEDSEIAWRMKRKGFRVAFDPKLIVFAQDQRRLRRGVLRKTLHSLTRCTLLYLHLLPERWLRNDWGYWSDRNQHQPAPAQRSAAASR